MVSLFDLGDEIMVMIARHLSPADVLRLTSTCNRMGSYEMEMHLDDQPMRPIPIAILVRMQDRVDIVEAHAEVRHYRSTPWIPFEVQPQVCPQVTQSTFEQLENLESVMYLTLTLHEWVDLEELPHFAPLLLGLQVAPLLAPHHHTTTPPHHHTTRSHPGLAQLFTF